MTGLLNDSSKLSISSQQSEKTNWYFIFTDDINKQAFCILLSSPIEVFFPEGVTKTCSQLKGHFKSSLWTWRMELDESLIKCPSSTIPFVESINEKRKLTPDKQRITVTRTTGKVLALSYSSCFLLSSSIHFEQDLNCIRIHNRRNTTRTGIAGYSHRIEPSYGFIQTSWEKYEQSFSTYRMMGNTCCKVILE